MDNLQTQFGFISVKGKRDANEDYLGTLEGDTHSRSAQGIAAAIADGMGGARGGRQAAETTVRGFLDAYFSLPETLGVDRATARAIAAMNRWVFAQRRQDPELENMATTFSALILRGRHAHVVHIGDTRIYRLREQRLQRLTSDHIHNHPDMRHVLSRAVGLEDNARVDYARHELKLHDRFLLCSDGVHGALTDRRLTALLVEGNSPEEAAQRIVDTALHAGSHDNATALVLDVVGLPPPDQDDLVAAIEALPVPPLPKTGDCIDDFRLDERLFDGRYSRLFRAWDNLESREVVLKFPHPRVAEENSHRQSFAREAWICARAHSPWLIDTIELAAGRQTRLYSVMQLYSGETMEQRLLREPKLSLAAGIDIGIKLAKAVYSLNRLRIIHRDIKPENVMLLKDGGLKLLDLGVAQLPGVTDEESQSAPGTPSYMAPELYHGAHGDEQSEVYALGITLYRLLSGGHYPYGEVEAFSRPRFIKYTPLSQYRTDLPAWLDALLAKATATEVDKRHADAMGLAFELEDGLNRGAKTTTQVRPLLERDPVRFWQSVSFVLAVLLFAVLVLNMG